MDHGLLSKRKKYDHKTEPNFHPTQWRSYMIGTAPCGQDDAIHGGNCIRIQEKQKPESKVNQGTGVENDSGCFHIRLDKIFDQLSKQNTQYHW